MGAKGSKGGGGASARPAPRAGGEPPKLLRVLVVGDEAVGKSSLVKTFVEHGGIKGIAPVLMTKQRLNLVICIHLWPKNMVNNGVIKAL